MSGSAHPVAWMSDRAQRTTFVVLVVLFVLLTTFLAVMGGPLRTDAAPRGIVSFELAGSGAAAAAILDAWPAGVRRIARLHLWVDYVYLLVYPALLSFACGWVALRLGGRARAFSALGWLLAWAVLAAGVLDAVENAALLEILASGASDELALRAAWTAIAKFALVGVALAYAVLGLAAHLFLGRAEASA